MTADAVTVEPPGHPLHALATFELRDYRRELERARRDLHVSLALAMPGSPVSVPILAQLSAIDTELAGRTGRPIP